ncbi:MULTISPECIES: GNAT family N-acetyltransferase [unclassified Roseovarius]|uniref:GNAT family N-acetyltransferase n=1 Tax=unclassified Roseovarius TaxID=2614913 RepID=UPI00273FD968|nr:MULTISPECIES: GNAT family N-acetyltransferase [unclassified Roseovarius]
MVVAVDIPRFETERLILRAPGVADTAPMLGFLASDRAEFYGGPMNASDGWHKFSAYVGQWVLRGYGMFSVALRDTDQCIGMAGPFHPDHFDEPEMSWLLTSAEFERKGYAAEACRGVLDHLFTTHGWRSVISYIDRANAPSRQLAERLGARFEAAVDDLVPNCDSYRHFAAGPAA